MADVESGSPVEARIDDGDGGSLLVPAIALGPADIGQDTDAIQTADRGPFLSQFTLTANAANVGEMRKTDAGNQASALMATTFSAAVSQDTPTDQGPAGGAFWALGADNERTIATNTDRIHTFNFQTVNLMSQWKVEVLDSATCDVVVTLRWLTIADLVYPAVAEVALASGSDTSEGPVGTRRTINLNVGAGTITAARFPSLMKVEIENRGDNSAVAVYKQYPVF